MLHSSILEALLNPYSAYPPDEDKWGMEQVYIGLALGVSFTVVFLYRLKSTSAGINVITYNVDRL